MEETNTTNPKAKYSVPAIASFMAPVHALTLEKPSSWHPFTRLLETKLMVPSTHIV